MIVYIKRPFFSPDCGENNVSNGFFLTAATRRSMCEGLSLEIGWFFEPQPQLSPILRLGYKFWVTENRDNLGKSRHRLMLKA